MKAACSIDRRQVGILGRQHRIVGIGRNEVRGLARLDQIAHGGNCPGQRQRCERNAPNPDRIAHFFLSVESQRGENGLPVGHCNSSSRPADFFFPSISAGRMIFRSSLAAALFQLNSASSALRPRFRSFSLGFPFLSTRFSRSLSAQHNFPFILAGRAIDD